jgi:hypothetical protein
MRNLQRGMSFWPFIICLLLVLIMGFLWYDEKGQHEKTTEKLNTSQKDNTALQETIAKREQMLDDISGVVGFQTITEGNPPRHWTDYKLVQKHLDPLGEVAGAAGNEPGSLAWLNKNTTLTMDPAIFKAAPNQKGTTDADIATISQAFKDKLKEVEAARPKDAPVFMTDEDNAGALAQFKSEMEAYQTQMAEYIKKFDELIKMKDDFEKYHRVIAAGSVFESLKSDPMKFAFLDQPATQPITVEAFFKLPAPVIKRLMETFSENMKANATTIAQKNEEIAALNKSLAEKDAALKGEQQVHVDDVTKLQGEATTANQKAEEERVKRTQAENALQTKSEESKKEKTRSDTKLTALEDRIRLDKEVRDLEIKRNDKDGDVLDASATLGTGAINLGSADKVYPGLRFEVSYYGRGGIREPKGTVVVTRVSGEHYSQVRIEQQVSDAAPIGRGDMIANPFYNAKKPIHVYLAGDLRKYPRKIAERRLSEMGVIIDAQLTSTTDYIVVPASLTAPAPGGTPPPEGAPAGGEKAAYDKLAEQARQFGATLVTERMLENFLQY